MACASVTAEAPARTASTARSNASASSLRLCVLSSPVRTMISTVLELISRGQGARPPSSPGPRRRRRCGVVSGRDRPLGAVLDGVAHRGLVLGRHLVHQHGGVAVVEEVEDLGAEAPADAVAAAAVGVDLHLHEAAPATGVNWMCSWVRPRRMKVGTYRYRRAPTGP